MVGMDSYCAFHQATLCRTGGSKAHSALGLKDDVSVDSDSVGQDYSSSFRCLSNYLKIRVEAAVWDPPKRQRRQMIAPRTL
jgi:hypothetical protein